MLSEWKVLDFISQLIINNLGLMSWIKVWRGPKSEGQEHCRPDYSMSQSTL